MFTATVARAHLLISSAIMLAEILPWSWIWFSLSLGTGLGAIRPVCVLAGVHPPRDIVEGFPLRRLRSTRGFLECVSDSVNSTSVLFLVVHKGEGFSANPPSRARAGALLPGSGPAGLDSAQYCWVFSFFFFNRTLEICRKM
jgi:hypothetical protein